jgi:hypothetical protein
MLLSRVGFTVSYDEVDCYKKSVMQCSNDDLPEAFPNAFTQFSADNVDHNVCTLDGLGTFHSMGIISMTTANINLETSSVVGSQLAISRLTCNKQSIVFRNCCASLVQYMVPEHSPLSSVIFQPWLHLQQLYVLPLDTNLDFLWHSDWFFNTDSNLRSSWSASMHDCSGLQLLITPSQLL